VHKQNLNKSYVPKKTFLFENIGENALNQELLCHCLRKLGNIIQIQLHHWQPCWLKSKVRPSQKCMDGIHDWGTASKKHSEHDQTICVSLYLQQKWLIHQG